MNTSIPQEDDYMATIAKIVTYQTEIVEFACEIIKESHALAVAMANDTADYSSDELQRISGYLESTRDHIRWARDELRVIWASADPVTLSDMPQPVVDRGYYYNNDGLVINGQQTE